MAGRYTTKWYASSVVLGKPSPSKEIALGGDSALCASLSQSALVIAIPRVCGSIPVVKFKRSTSWGPEGREGMFPRAFITARVAQALLTTWCAKKPGKSGSNWPEKVDDSSEETEGSHLNRKMRAWRGWRDARDSGSKEYKSSTISGTPRVLRRSLVKDLAQFQAWQSYLYIRENTWVRLG